MSSELISNNVLAEPWWPLDVAVAWMMTRDRAFLQNYWTTDGNFLRLAIALAMEKTPDTPSAHYYDSIDQAWAELKPHLGTGKVRITGAPFTSVDDGGSTTIETGGTQRDITDAEMSSLQLLEQDGELCLVPSDWRVARGSNWKNLRGYKNIRLWSANILNMDLPRRSPDLPGDFWEPPLSPFDSAVISLSQAAYWVASEGGANSINFRDVEVWREAFYKLMRSIRTGKIVVNGRKEGKGLPIVIPAVSFAGLSIDYPYTDASMAHLLAEKPHIRCYGPVSEEMWEQGFYDALISRRWGNPDYTHLLVDNEDLAREYPFKPIAGHSQGTNKRGFQDEIQKTYRRLWPDGNAPTRKKDRDDAIRKEMRTSLGERTIRRALSGFDPKWNKQTGQ